MQPNDAEHPSDSEQSCTPLPLILPNIQPTHPLSQSSNDLVQVCQQSKFSLLSCFKSVCCILKQIFRSNHQQKQQNQQQQQSEKQKQTEEIYVTNDNNDLIDLIISLQNEKIEPIIKSNPLFSKTLVLDLDETLIHTRFQERECQYSDYIQINNSKCYFYTDKRPGVQQFIRQVSKYYEIVVYTAGLKQYAEKVVSFIDPNKVIKHVLYRKHCISVNKMYIKNLKLIDRELKDIVLVDNNPNSGLLQPDNLLVIKTFKSEMNDTELLGMVGLLKYLSKVEDVREVERHRERYYQKITNKENNKLALLKGKTLPVLQKKSSSNQYLQQSNKKAIQYIR